MATTEERILSIIGQYYPELDAGPGTPFYEYVVRPTAFLWAKHDQAATEFIEANTLDNYANMSEDDMDRIVSKFFVTRKVGVKVTASIRLNFFNRADYTIPADTLVDMGGGRLYRIPNQIIITALSLNQSVQDSSFYTLLPIISEGTGNIYNLLSGVTVPTTSINFDFSDNLRSAYIDSDSTDGGYSETNVQFYYRIKNSLSARNLTTYRGVRGTLFENFSIQECTPIGLRDSELVRDLITVKLPSNDIVTFHRGGHADIYVKMPPYTLVSGYSTGSGRPLGFPYTYVSNDGVSCSIDTNPAELMGKWEDDIPENTLVKSLDVSLRGSVLEVIPSLTELAVTNLTSNITAIHNYVVNTDNEALHSDNLVKQYWPIVTLISVDIVDSRGAPLVTTFKKAIVEYVNNLYTGSFPRTDDIVHIGKNLGIREVRTPIALDGYYLTDNLHMEHIGILTDTVGTYREPPNSVLTPEEVDTLKFTTSSLNGQLTANTITWYTDENLVRVNLV